MRILLTGGTGSLGSEIANAATRSGHFVRIASRRSQPLNLAPGREWAQLDCASRESLSPALAGIDAVIHAATDPRRPEAVDVNGTRLLLDAAREAGLAHFVYVSIVGLEYIPVKYYRAKLAAEEMVRSSGVPFSILRATQFHSFVDHLLSGLARVPLILPVPSEFKIQSVARSEVAERLIRCMEEGPTPRLPDLGGPETLTIATAAEQWKQARGIQKPVVSIPLPSAAAAAIRAGRNTVQQGEHGKVTWSEWLTRSR